LQSRPKRVVVRLLFASEGLRGISAPRLSVVGYIKSPSSTAPPASPLPFRETV
jgi:hypothetical protein